MDTDLARRMIERADNDRLPPWHELRHKARLFEEACKGYFATVQTVKPPQLMKAWLEARKYWRTYSGEAIL